MDRFKLDPDGVAIDTKEVHLASEVKLRAYKRLEKQKGGLQKLQEGFDGQKAKSNNQSWGVYG